MVAYPMTIGRCKFVRREQDHFAPRMEEDAGGGLLSLSVDQVTAAANAEGPEEAEEIEIIFDTVQSIGSALERCTRLRSIACT